MNRKKVIKVIALLMILLSVLYILPPFMISSSGIIVAEKVDDFEQPADISHAPHSWSNALGCFLLFNFHVPDDVQFYGTVDYKKICPFVWKVKEIDSMYSVYKMKARKQYYYMIHLAP